MTQTTRAQALDTLREGYERLTALFSSLDDEKMSAPATIGGGDWSAKDLMGHIAHWEEIALEALAEWRAGRRPAVEDVFARGAEGVDETNARNYERTAAQSVEEVRARAAAAHEALVTAIDEMSDEEWTAKAPYPTERRAHAFELIGSIVGAPKRPFGHAFAHLADLEAYAKPPT